MVESADGKRAGHPRHDGPPVAPGLGYRAGLDGLRALAVLAVLAYHTGVLRSGWIGVDVFFALSGYLITGLLIGELDSTGTVRLGRFWARRLRRLLPGIVLLLGFVAFLGGLALPDWTAPHLDDVIGTVTYSSNWLRVLGEQSYWDLFRTPGPLEHVWSLAVEEQFYVVWPLVIWAVARVRRSWLVPVTVALLLGTSGLQVWLATHGASVERLYVGTDTRAPAFLLGALFVLVGDRGGRIAAWAEHTLPVTLAWLLAAAVVVDGQALITYQGVLLGVSVLGAFTVLGAARVRPTSAIGRFLRWWPLHRLGRWSYGVYLYHWPVAIALRGQHMLGIQRFALVSGISIALAAASYELLEHPIRRGGVPRQLRIPALVGSAAILLAACGNVAPEQGRRLDAATRAELLTPLAAPAPSKTSGSDDAGSTTSTVSTSSTTSIAPTSSASGAAEESTEPVIVEPPSPTTTDAATTVPTTRPAADAAPAIGTPFVATPDNALDRPAEGTRVLVVGDSVPFQLMDAWGRIAPTRDTVVAVRAAPGCTPSTEVGDHYRNDTRDVCAAVQANLADDLAAFTPSALIVYYGLAGPTVTQDGQQYDVCAEQGAEVLRRQLDRIVGLARDAGVVAFLVPPANPPALDWLDVEAQATGAACYRKVYEQLAGSDRAGVRLLRVDQYVCPTDPRSCPDEVDGVALRYDGIHFSENGAAHVIPWIHDRLFRP